MSLIGAIIATIPLVIGILIFLAVVVIRLTREKKENHIHIFSLLRACLNDSPHHDKLKLIAILSLSLSLSS